MNTMIQPTFIVVYKTNYTPLHHYIGAALFMAIDRQPTPISTASVEFFDCVRPANYLWDQEKNQKHPVCANYNATIVENNVFAIIRKAYPASRVVK
jgi:hypothetical protein